MIRRLPSLKAHLTVLFVLVISLSACRKPLGEIIIKPESTPAIVDRGDLKLHYEPRKSLKKSDEGHRVGENQPAIAALITDLNQKINLPYDIGIYMQDCDAADAYYDPEAHRLIICHQLIDEYYSLFSTKLKDRTKFDDAVRGATAATFFHELGHALIDAWKLPITGKEEDAADQLSTLILINRTDSGERMALDGAISFKLYAETYKDEKKIFWDEHSLDEQRYYDTLCMLYGHNPKKV